MSDYRKLRVHRIYAWAVYDENDVQLSYDCARKDEAIEEMKLIKEHLKKTQPSKEGW